jgi:hypothetical protein
MTTIFGMKYILARELKILDCVTLRIIVTAWMVNVWVF